MGSLFDIPKYLRDEDSIYFNRSLEFCGDGGWNFNRSLKQTTIYPKYKTPHAPNYSNNETTQQERDGK